MTDTMTPEQEAINTGKVTVNETTGLYIIPSFTRGGKVTGYSCLGFDYLMQKYTRLAGWLRTQGAPAEDLPADARGTLRAYDAYALLLTRIKLGYERAGQRCTAELCPQLLGLEGKRVEVEHMDGRTARFTVGMSTGWVPTHLAIGRRSRSDRPSCGFPVSGPFKRVTVIGPGSRP